MMVEHVELQQHPEIGDARVRLRVMTRDRTMEAQSADAGLGPSSWLALAGWTGLSVAAGLIGSIASRSAADFYGASRWP